MKTPIAIDFMVPNNPETRQMAEVIQSMAAEAGFDIKIRITEFATSLNEAEAGRFQAYALNWSGRPDPDGNLYIFHKTEAPQNYGGYSNPQVDAALDEARVKNAIAERKAIYEKVAGTLLSEGSVVYLYHRLWIIAHTAKLDGFKLLPDGLVRVVGLRLKIAEGACDGPAHCAQRASAAHLPAWRRWGWRQRRVGRDAESALAARCLCLISGRRSTYRGCEART